MKIKINGEICDFKKPISISELVKLKKIENQMIAIEKNYKIIQKQDYSSTILKDGDSIEIVTLCSGG